jgi:hypothetical protein
VKPMSVKEKLEAMAQEIGMSWDDVQHLSIRAFAELIAQKRAERRDLLADVTEASFAAEKAFSALVTAYETLKAAEQRILDSMDSKITEEDKAISQQGVAGCAEVLSVLRSWESVDLAHPPTRVLP